MVFLTKPLDLKHFKQTLSQYLVIDKSASVAKVTAQDELGEAMRNIVEHFLRGLPTRLETITRAAALHDWPTLYAEAHKLKGIGGNVGYPELTRAATEIGDAATQHDAQKVAESVGQLATLCMQALRKEPDLQSAIKGQ